MVTIKTIGVDEIPQVGQELTARVALPSSFAPEANRGGLAGGIASLAAPTSLVIDTKPNGPADLVPVVRVLASVEAVAFLSRLSRDEFTELMLIGRGTAHSANQQLDLLDSLAEKFLLAQARQITTLNLIGPETWRGVLRTTDLTAGRSYGELLESDKSVARNNVRLIAAALASMPAESLQIIQDLKEARPGIASFVDPISTLSDRVIKRAVGSNFDAWRVRKALENSDHPDANKTIQQLPPSNRLFAGMMGLGTFQMLRDHGKDVCEGLIVLGNRLREGVKRVSLPAMNSALNSESILTTIPFQDGSSLGLQPATMQHLARAHHEGVWVMNRALSFLLPEALRQGPRSEHRPFSENPQNVQNQTCINILCLAVALANEARSGGMANDLIKSAAPGNPLGLDMSIKS